MLALLALLAVATIGAFLGTAVTLYWMRERLVDIQRLADHIARQRSGEAEAWAQLTAENDRIRHNIALIAERERQLADRVALADEREARLDGVGLEVLAEMVRVEQERHELALREQEIQGERDRQRHTLAVDIEQEAAPLFAVEPLPVCPDWLPDANLSAFVGDGLGDPPAEPIEEDEPQGPVPTADEPPAETTARRSALGIPEDPRVIHMRLTAQLAKRALPDDLHRLAGI